MKYYLKNAKHLYIREYFKDESWDMIYEALKLLAKKEGFDDMFKEYDKKIQKIMVKELLLINKIWLLW